MACTDTSNPNQEAQPDKDIKTYNTACNDSADSNEDVFLLYFTGSYKSILLLANALVDLKDNNPHAYYLALEVFKDLLDLGMTHHIVRD